MGCVLGGRRWRSVINASLRKVQVNITGADKKLVATEAQVDAQEKEVCQTIKRSFVQLKAVLEQREMKVLNKAVTLAREKDALMAQRKGLQMAETEIQSLVEFVERNVENTSEEDLMVIFTQLQAKMEEEEKHHQQLSLEPATTADITYDPPSPDAIPRNLGEVLQLPQMPQVCEVGDLLSIQLGKPSKMMTLKATGQQNPTIQGELESLVVPTSSVQADVVLKGVGVYNITCTPPVRGRHDLRVKVNGKDIVGSPFRVFVKIHALYSTGTSCTNNHWSQETMGNSSQQQTTASGGRGWWEKGVNHGTRWQEGTDHRV